MLVHLFLSLWMSSTLVVTDRTLDQAVKAKDISAIQSRMEELAKEQKGRAVRPIVDAVAEVEAAAEGSWYSVDRYRVFLAGSRTLAKIPGPVLDKELGKIISKHPEWPARTLALYSSMLSASSDTLALALKALNDKTPQVVIAAANLLGKSQEILAIEPLISGMKRWEDQKTRERAAKGGREELEKKAKDRAWLACRDALHRLTGVSLHNSGAYKSWVSTHQEDLDPKNVDLDKVEEQTTGTGLFGLEITGRNIAFIIDISGSMMATDPPSDEQMERISRSTGVGKSVDERIAELMESRRRILRARTELKRAIEGLGENKRFTVIAYSSEVTPWSPVLKDADKKNRGSAVSFIDSLKASGITVTDEALNIALSDPTLDTIYLVTDGAPTHIGSRGSDMPPDSQDLMRRILAETRAVNHLRGIRIFTLGFVDAEEEFLKKLAGENNGRYVRIR